MYTYYKEEHHSNHYLFAGEIAEYFRLYTKKNKPHKKFVAAYYDNKISETGERLFYNTRSGLVRVLPGMERRVCIEKMLTDIVTSPRDEDGCYLVVVNDRTYRVKIGNPEKEESV